jgi:hypothetical protein
MKVHRLALVLLPAVTAVPLLAAPASASCTDDLAATNLQAGYAPPPGGYSPQWPFGYVRVTGTATVTVYGEAAISDGSYLVADESVWLPTVAGNWVGAVVDFEDCVAG